MTDFKIEKGIPVAPSHSTAMRARRSKWAAFEVGDSAFFVGNSPKGPVSARQWAIMQNPRRRFAQRKTVENGVEGTRIWRVE